MKRPIRLSVALLLAIIAGYVAFRLVPKPLPVLSREQFLTEVREGHVHKVVIEDQERIIGSSSTKGRFLTPYNKAADAQLAGELRALGVEVVFQESSPGLI